MTSLEEIRKSRWPDNEEYWYKPYGNVYRVYGKDVKFGPFVDTVFYNGKEAGIFKGQPYETFNTNDWHVSTKQAYDEKYKLL